MFMPWVNPTTRIWSYFCNPAARTLYFILLFASAWFYFTSEHEPLKRFLSRAVFILAAGLAIASWFFPAKDFYGV